MSTIVVSKFGGTSMGTKEAMVSSAEVCLDQKSRIVVVSATSGTTNDLIQFGQSSEKGEAEISNKLLEKIESRHQQLIASWPSSQEEQQNLQALFKELETLGRGIFYLKECSPRAMDALMSLGERLSSLIFTCCLREVAKKRGLKKQVELFDVRKVIITDDQFGKARALTHVIADKAQSLLNVKDENRIYVTQGFVGATEEGLTTTLGRGGSDYSAAILAEAVHADALEIWTDVAGISTTDPRLCKDARAISEISFKEASELATFGAKILHPATLIPAMRRNIPVYVANTFDPAAGGTWVRRDVTTGPLV
ncbi:MAG: aspartate kinase, partial [Bdellovibrionota bacterium]